MSVALEQLCIKIGYQFKDLKRLEKALSHRSVVGQNNERLEFLGDSLLNMVIAEALFLQFDKADEGTLSRLRAHLVREKTLSEVALELMIQDFLRLGPGELKTGGHNRGSIRADALEAIIAAIYLDADFATVRTCILQWFSTRLAQISPKMTLKDPKTRLQEALQGKQWQLPEYEVVDISGKAHEQHFEVACKIANIEQDFIGQGASRRKAEQAAAALALDFINEK